MPVPAGPQCLPSVLTGGATNNPPSLAALVASVAIALLVLVLGFVTVKLLIRRTRRTRLWCRSSGFLRSRLAALRLGFCLSSLVWSCSRISGGGRNAGAFVGAMRGSVGVCWLRRGAEA